MIIRPYCALFYIDICKKHIRSSRCVVLRLEYATLCTGMRAISSVESPHLVPQGAWQENVRQSWRSSTARVQCYDGLFADLL